MLQTILENALAQKRMSSHKAAEAIGVSHTTILRAMRGLPVDVDTIIKIANFLNLRPSELLNSMDDNASLGDQITVLLSHSRELEDGLRDAVARVQGGQLDPAILKDIVSYAIYRLNSSGAPNVTNNDEETNGGRQS